MMCLSRNNLFPRFFTGYFGTVSFNRDFRFSHIVQPVVVPDNRELTVIFGFHINDQCSEIYLKLVFKTFIGDCLLQAICTNLRLLVKKLPCNGITRFKKRSQKTPPHLLI